MNYYLVDKDLLTIISGPFSLYSSEMRRLTSCGNPECLPPDHLFALSIVPEVSPEKTELQKYDGVTVYFDRVEKNVVEKTQEELDAEVEQFNVSQRSQRQAAYQAESDPIFFDYQRGEATKADWDAKVAEIKGRFPYAEDVNADGVVTQADSPTVWAKFKSFFGF